MAATVVMYVFRFIQRFFNLMGFVELVPTFGRNVLLPYSG
jgi:hypothetical protein